MKYAFTFSILVAFLFFGTKVVFGQTEPEKLDLPGDNLNLYSVLKIFQESETLELFEKKLNDEEAQINNLDLDGDENIDYIKVIDNVDGNVHNIVLQVAVNENENQDVAVIVVEKKSNGEVEIQVIGDEELYGRDYIIEPNFENSNSGSTPNPGYNSNPNVYTEPIAVQTITTYQVASWPVVQYVYRPNYIIWVSPWRWHYYPPYWRPWRPQFWHYYYGYHYHWNYYYYGHYRRGNYYRYGGWNNFYYTNRRARSNYVVVRRDRGDYRNTYTRPELAKTGSDRFKRDNPKSPSANIKLPPAITRPTNPSPEKPGVTNPVTRPGVTPTKPATKPTPTKPVTKPMPTKPVTKPKPTKPITKPTPTKPVARPTPTKPVTKPVPAKPVTKPTPVAPKPISRPTPPASTTRPGVKPVPQPSTPSTRN